MRIVYLVMGLTFAGLLALWQFWPSQTSKPQATPLHEHVDLHGHHDENVVVLSPEQMQQLEIPLLAAGPSKLSIVISTRGKIVVHPDKLVHVLPKIPGVAKEARKNIGDLVHTGEVLAILESREMADSKANYLAAKEKERLTLSLLEREKRLYDQKVSAQQDYINAQSAYREAQIAVQLNQQKLRAFGVEESEIRALSQEQPDLRVYDIRSPIDGVVIARHINRGEFIETTATIYEIVDLSSVWIEIGIYPKDLIKVKEGQKIDVMLPSNVARREATIIYVSPIIQDETITAKAVAELKNPDRNWRPGSFVRVDIATGDVTVPLAIPKEAIAEIDGKQVVFVKIPEGFEKRPVETGAEDRRNVEILSGLSPGEVIAASNTFLLKAELNKAQAEHEHR